MEDFQLLELTKNEFEKWLEKQYPFEACGIRSGLHFYPVRTMGVYKDNFIINSKFLAEILDIIDDIDDIVFIHSHIDSEAIASEMDIAMMKNWAIDHIIYSIYEGEINEKRFYRKSIPHKES